MKQFVLVVLFFPFFATAQLVEKNDKKEILPGLKVGVSLNILALADVNLPTIQPGVIFKINKRLINEFDFGFPVHFNNNIFDTIPEYFTHFKIKNALLYNVGKRNFFIGGMLYYTDVNRFRKNGKYKDDFGEYSYTSAAWKKKIWGYGFKMATFFNCKKRLFFAVSTTIGQRFVNATILPKSISPNPILAKDFGNFFERAGRYTTPHLEIGFKTIYKL